GQPPTPELSDCILNFSFHIEPKDLVAVKLHGYLPDPLQPRFRKASKSKHFRAFDVQLDDINVGCSDFSQQQLQRRGRHVDGLLENAVELAALGKIQDAAALIVLGHIEANESLRSGDCTMPHGKVTLRPKRFDESRIRLDQMVSARIRVAQTTRKGSAVGADIDNDRIWS